MESNYDKLSVDQKNLLQHDFWLRRYCELVANYPGAKKQLQRVMFNVAVSHMSKDEPKFSYPEEKELFDAGMQMNAAKFFIMVDGLVKDGVLQYKPGETQEQQPVLEEIPAPEKEPENGRSS